jgi:hypothetical protein
MRAQRVSKRITVDEIRPRGEQTEVARERPLARAGKPHD